MYVIAVTPLKKGITVASLSYFSKTEYPYGTIVSIPVRGKTMLGIVTKAEPVSATKATLRTAAFRLRKLPEQKKPSQLPGSIIQTAQELAARVPAQPGAILFALLPKEVRDGNLQYPAGADITHQQDTVPMVLQDKFGERMVHYRSFVRSALAHRGSTLVVVPTVADVDRVTEHLTHGIEERVVILHSALPKRAREQAFQKIADLTSAELIITTPQYAFLDRADLTHIIVEQAGNRFYTARTRPYLNFVEALKIYAKVSGRALLLGDIMPSTEDERARREDVYITSDEHPNRLAFPSSFSVITQDEPIGPNTPLVIFSATLQEKIAQTIASKGNVFCFAARRGLATFVVCVDCSHIFRCPDSGAPYTLLRTTEQGEEKRWFISATSGRRERAADTCPVCGGWRLRERGIGIQQVSDAFTELFPQVPYRVFDHTTVTTHKRACALRDDFAALRGGVLIGTSMSLPYLPENVALTGVLSFDAARTMSSWRADEQTLRFLLQLRDITTTEVVVQTRTKDEPLLTLAKRGAVDSFYREELELREAVGYPPFAVLILLTFQGSKAQVKQIEAEITTQLRTHTPHFYNNPHFTSENVIRYGLLRIPKASWPDSTLVDALRTLPPYVKVEIDPDRIV